VNLLLDEHVHPGLLAELRRRLPELVIRQIGEDLAPQRGTPDPEILVWCEEHQFHLVTNNRRTMPAHLADHLAAGRHVPGILTIDLSETLGVLVQELQDIVELSRRDEYRDRIEYVPFR